MIFFYIYMTDRFEEQPYQTWDDRKVYGGTPPPPQKKKGGRVGKENFVGKSKSPATMRYSSICSTGTNKPIGCKIDVSNRLSP